MLELEHHHLQPSNEQRDISSKYQHLLKIKNRKMRGYRLQVIKPSKKDSPRV